MDTFSLDERITKTALDQIANETKSSIISMYLLCLFLLYIFQDYLSITDLLAIFFIHTFVFIYRASYLYRYFKQKEKLENHTTVTKWVWIFRSGSFVAALGWGSFFFFLQNTPVEYNLIIIMTVIGLAAIGMSTVGALFSVYLSFMVPMLSLALIWIIVHSSDNEIYENIILPFFMLIGYLIFAAKRFAYNFTQSYRQEHRANLLNERMELALDGSSTAILDWDFKKNSLFISNSWILMLGLDSHELLNKLNIWKKSIHPDDRKPFFSSLKEHIKNKKEIFESVHRLQKKDGNYIWVFGRARIFYDEKNNASRMIGTHTDITKRKMIEADSEEKKRVLEESQRLAHIGSWKFDIKKQELHWSEEIYRIFEVPRNEKPSYDVFLQIVHPQDREMVHKAYLNSLDTKKPYELVHRLLFSDGRVKYVKEECETSFDIENRPLVSIGTIQDITEQKLLENMLKKQKETLSHLAHHDTLTGLPNRNLLTDRLSKAIALAKRDHTIFALFFIDLDRFKEINDSLGHTVGDEVLKEVSKRFQAIMRKTDTLARLGGDEFTIIMESLKEGQDASRLAEKLLDILAKPINIQDHTLYLSCSIGISLYPGDGESAEDLLKYADAAMYRAKEEGRGDFQFYSSEMTMLAFERVVMEASIRSALKNNEFEVYYQAQVNAKESRLIGMEALVRWQHANMGLVYPSKFIPLAESTGLIVQLDRFVIKKAMKELSSWYKKGLNPGILALNLSMANLQQKDFITFIQSALQESECQAEWLEFEVTESQIMTNPQEAIKVLEELNHLGATVAIDDFGTGYSSLSYLKKLPIDKLKIDQSFIRDLPDDEEDVAITKAVIALAKSLKLNLIAEGVESSVQKDFIVSNGCDNIQGYYYAKAVPKEEFEDILINGIVNL